MKIQGKYPVSEIFGPTVQGEGERIGTQTLFLRLAGCDFDCTWCDTKYAVLPKYAGWKQTLMDEVEICEALNALHSACNHVTISGGNPALFVDHDLMQEFLRYGFYATVETQGSKAFIPTALIHPALRYLVISPKPPSSGMATRMDPLLVASMISNRNRFKMHTTLKYVVFSEEDLQWIETFDRSVREKPTEKCLSIGTTVDGTLAYEALVFTVIQDAIRWTERVLHYEYFKDFRILPQLHTLLWGRKRGV